MCLVHAPSASTPTVTPQYLHNPYLDGASMGGLGANQGRNSLRTDLGTAGAAGLSTAPSGNASPGMTLSQPGTVVPTVGGAMAGVMAGRVTSPLPSMALARV